MVFFLAGLLEEDNFLPVLFFCSCLSRSRNLAHSTRTKALIVLGKSFLVTRNYSFRPGESDALTSVLCSCFLGLMS